MRILHVVSSLDPTTGGPAVALKSFAEVSQGAQDEMEITCLDPSESSFLKDFPVPTHALGGARTSYCWSPALRPWMMRNSARFDAIIAHGLWQWQGLCTRAAALSSARPYFVFPHGMLDPWFKKNYPLKHLKKCIYWPWAEYRVLRDARAVLFTTEEEALLAKQSFPIYRCTERIVGFGASVPTGDVPSQKEQFLNAFPFLKGRRFLLFLGRIHEKKGCDLLIRAFARLCSSKSQLGGRLPDLVLAGPCAHPQYYDEINDLARSLGVGVQDHTSAAPLENGSGADRAFIHFVPMLSGDVKWGAFHASEAFVLPSHQENFGVAVAESLACGVPVLISNKVNIWREVARTRAGLIGDDTVEGTIRLLQNWMELSPEDKSTMRDAARKCFLSEFEMKQAAERIVQTVREFQTSNKVHSREV